MPREIADAAAECRTGGFGEGDAAFAAFEAGTGQYRLDRYEGKRHDPNRAPLRKPQ